MAGHHYHNSQMSRMDRTNQPRNEPPPFGQKLFVHPRGDAPNGAGPSGYGVTTVRSNELPSSSYTGQSYGQQIGAPGTLHASHAGYPPAGSSSSSYAPYNTQHVPSLIYPRRSEDSFIPGVHVDDRRVAPKRRNPITHPVDGISAGGYYPGSSSNNHISGYMPLNPVPTRETCPPQISSNMGSSHWNDHQFLNHEGSQRNVRGRHDHSSIHSEYNSSTACPSSSVHVPPYHPNANAPFGAPVQRERAPLSLPPRIVPLGTDGSTGIAFRERQFYPAPQSTNISAPVPPLPGSSDGAPFARIGYTPRPVHHNAGHNYPPPAFTTSSNSGAVRQPRHVSVGHGGSARSRRMRDSYHCFHPLMIEENNLGRSAAERFMMLDQLVIHESREALDPHWDMRLDIDDMSYEELLALEERIGNVSTGLADEKISGCVMELACRNSARAQNDQDKERCIICLEEYKHKDSLGKLKCGHDFHAGCIKKWLEVKNACPVCKADAANETT
ncbi:hypothetical protein ACQJBY_001120 [Aegilops geniculata]